MRNEIEDLKQQAIEQGKQQLKQMAKESAKKVGQQIWSAIAPILPYIIIALVIIIIIAGLIDWSGEDVDAAEIAGLNTATDDAWEQFFRHIEAMEGGMTVYKNSEGVDCYKVLYDGFGGYAICGLDMRYYGRYFSGLGYGTSEGALIPTDIVTAKKIDATKNGFYAEVENSLASEGITLKTGYQLFAITSRAFNCGSGGAVYHDDEYGMPENFVSAYKNYWKESDDKYQQKNEGDFSHKIYTNCMQRPIHAGGEVAPGLITRRKAEWTLFQCGFYSYLNEWYVGDSSSSGASGIIDSAKKIHDYMKDNKYQYCDKGSSCGDHSNGHGLNETFEQSKTGYHNVCCATYVSWVLRDCGLIKETNHIAPTLANTLESSKYKFKRITGKNNFQEGDILVSDGHIEIYAGNNQIYNAGYQGAIDTVNPYNKGDWSKVKYALRAPTTAGKEGTTSISGLNIKTYTTSKGRKYILYQQHVGPWSGLSYASGGNVYGTVGAVGCPTSACATAVSAFNQGKNLTPTDFRDAIYPTTIGGALRNLGFNITYYDGFDRDRVINQLKKGYPVIYRVTSASIFTNNQHWMALIDISSDGKKIYVASGSSGSAAGWYDIDTAFYAADEYFIFNSIS